MIHQCYFRTSQRNVLFEHPPYKPFGLEPEVNADLFVDCPELRNPSMRLAILEYAAMLWHWRNPEADCDPWIGFTSYRQIEKGYRFEWESKEHVKEALIHHDLACWGHMRFTVTLSQQAELFHPGLNEFMGRILGYYGVTVPRDFHTSHEGCFASYWVMTRTLFNEWMKWLWPFMLWCFTHTHLPYLMANAKWHVLERLFNVWYMTRQPKIIVVGCYQGEGTQGGEAP